MDKQTLAKIALQKIEQRNNFLQNHISTKIIYTQEKKDSINKFTSISFNDFLLRPIEEIDLTNHCTKTLKVHGVYLVGHLIQKTIWDIMKMENLGKKSWTEIQNALYNKGWRLAEYRDRNN
jgi:DNA-directed RNA polymerase alpha subunit